MHGEPAIVSGVLSPSLLSGACTKARSAKQSGVGVENNLHRHRLEHRFKRGLGAKCAKERTGRERGQDLRRDAAADEHAAGRHRAQRQIASFRAVGLDEQAQRLDAPWAVAGERRRRNRRGRLGIVEIDGRGAGAVVTDAMDIQQTSTGDDVFDLRASAF